MMEYILKTVMALAVVGGLLYLTCFLAAKLKRNAGCTKGTFIHVIERVTLGAEQSLAVAKVEDKTYLLGVAQGGISLLCELQGQPASDGENAPPQSFAECLKLQVQGLGAKSSVKGAAKDE